MLTKKPTELFLEAEKFCRENGFGKEIDWCENRPPFHTVDDRRFLAEYAYVVYNSGMKNSVIEAKWEEISKAFLWFNANSIIDHEESVREKVLTIFGNKAKVDAVIKVAMMIYLSYEVVKERIEENVLEELDKLPFIGPVTKYHLARNLGFDYIKPDRHLRRLAKKYNMTPFEFAEVIRKETGRKLGVIDIILWRYSEQKGKH